MESTFISEGSILSNIESALSVLAFKIFSAFSISLLYCEFEFEQEEIANARIAANKYMIFFIVSDYTKSCIMREKANGPAMILSPVIKWLTKLQQISETF